MKIITDISEGDEAYLPSSVKVIRMKDKAISNHISVIDLDEKDMPELVKTFVVMAKYINLKKARVINMFSPVKNHA